MMCDLKIQFERHMNERKYRLAEPLVTAISALNTTEGLYRYEISSDAGSVNLALVFVDRSVTVYLLTGKLRF